MSNEKKVKKQNKSMMIDANMYRYDENNGRNYIKISTRKHSKFATFCLRDKNQYKGNLRILIRDKGIEIHRTVECRTQKVWVAKNIIAIDKGYNKLLATSQKKYYGTDLNKIATNATETLSEINKRRNPVYSRVRALKAEASVECTVLAQP